MKRKNEGPVTKAKMNVKYAFISEEHATRFRKKYFSYSLFCRHMSISKFFVLTRFDGTRTSIDGEGEVDLYAYNIADIHSHTMAISDHMLDNFFVECESFEPTMGNRYKHKSTGNVYLVLYLANIANSSKERPVQVVYIDDNGNVWTKTVDEFKFKFEEIEE